jgi:putative peptide zinc metalloprotease protein
MTTFLLRPDLQIKEIEGGRGFSWIIKDPLREEYFNQDSHEIALLKLFNGKRTLEQVREAYQLIYQDQELTAETLTRFVIQTRDSGLLVEVGPTRNSANTSPMLKNRAKQVSWSSHLWSTRLVSFNPTPMLRAVEHYFDGLYTTTFMYLALLLLLSAGCIVISRQELLLQQLVSAQVWMSPETYLVLLIGLIVVKLVHEFAHALTCHKAGAHCRETGIMLLLFMPVLFCDVSDAWFVRSRRQRMLISGAGILAELMLAALATWLWAFSQDGPARLFFLSLMMICSVNTLLINGNPLLRYDGYHLLTDLIGVPNLAPQSMHILRQQFYAWCYGMTVRSVEVESRTSYVLYLMFGFASMIYRGMISVAICYGIYVMFRSMGMKSIGSGLVLWMAAMLVIGFAAVLTRPVWDTNLRKQLKWSYLKFSMPIVLLILTIVLFFPIPQSLMTYGLTDLENRHDVYVTESGILESCIPSGTKVIPGDLIARLSDLKLSRHIYELQMQMKLLQLQIEQEKILAGNDLTIAANVIALEEKLTSIREQLQIKQTQEARLTIHAQQSGSVYPARDRPGSAMHSHQIDYWHGSLFDPRNQLCLVERGTPLCVIGASDKPILTAYVSQRDVEWLRVGQMTSNFLSGHIWQPVIGKIQSISPTPIEQLPPELARSQFFALSTTPGQSGQPYQPLYKVEVQCEQTEQIPLRTPTCLRIHLSPAPLALRIWRMVKDTFVFEL